MDDAKGGIAAVLDICPMRPSMGMGATLTSDARILFESVRLAEGTAVALELTVTVLRRAFTRFC